MEGAPRTWRESLYVGMEFIHASVANGAISLNALALLYGDQNSVIEWCLHTKDGSIVAKVGLKLLQMIPQSSIFMVTLFTIPLFVFLLYLMLLISVAGWVLQTAGNLINIKTIAENIPPSVGRVEVKVKST